MKRLVSCVVLLAVGCSSSPQLISESAVAIRRNAQSSRERFVVLEEPGGVREQDEIISEVDAITVQLPGVQSVVPAWVEPVKWASLAVAGLVLLALTWHLGLGQLSRSLIGWIPGPKRQAARILRDAVDPNDETTMREAVAALRAMDPLLDRAYRSLSK